MLKNLSIAEKAAKFESGDWIEFLYEKYENNLFVLGKHIADQLEMRKTWILDIEREQENLAYTIQFLEKERVIRENIEAQYKRSWLDVDSNWNFCGTA